MSTENLIDLFFSGMAKLGPGDDVHSISVLRSLPCHRFDVVVDAGCGSGRQTLALARELETMIHAVDVHAPFLDELMRRAKAAAVDHLVDARCMDMKDIPDVFPRIQLLWAEGSAYNIGFGHALTHWTDAIVHGGFAVVSELSWLNDVVPNSIREFFHAGYPAMQSVLQNQRIAERAGYSVLSTQTLPRTAWVEGYYDVLEPRARSLLRDPDSSVRDFARETLKEIEVFRESEDVYGYVFYALQRA